MENFIYENQTKIVFGKDTELEAGKLANEYGTNVLLHYGGGSIKRSGLYDRVKESLEEANLNVFELGGVVPNPRLSLVKEGIGFVRENKIDFILAVGGGSVIDSAKAIAAGAVYKGDVWDFFERKALVEKTLPIGVILTIPAAGSESSRSCVITNEDGWYKRGLNSPHIRPKFAIMNPELTYTLSQFQMACGVADMFSHVLERYFTHTKGVDFTSELCEATMRSIIKHAREITKNPLEYAPRAELMWESTMAHSGILGVGRVEDWASHAIEHELSAIYDIPHGEGLAIVFPAWMKYVYKEDKDRFVRFANKVFDVEIFSNIDVTIELGINELEKFFSEIGLKTRLSEINIPKDRFEEMAKKATMRGPLGNFLKLEREDVLNILELSH